MYPMNAESEYSWLLRSIATKLLHDANDSAEQRIRTG